MYFQDSDPNMRYESLARAAFNNCGKGEDPFGYAAQDFFNTYVSNEYLREPGAKAKRALSLVLSKFIIDNFVSRYETNGKEEFVQKMKSLDEKVWNAKTTKEMYVIVDEAIKIYLDYKVAK